MTGHIHRIALDEHSLFWDSGGGASCRAEASCPVNLSSIPLGVRVFSLSTSLVSASLIRSLIELQGSMTFRIKIGSAV